MNAFFNFFKTQSLTDAETWNAFADRTYASLILDTTK